MASPFVTSPSVAHVFSGEARRSRGKASVEQAITKATEGRQLDGMQEDMQDEIQRRIDDNSVVVMATSTCPFCDEAKRTLAAHGITGHFVDMDQELDTFEMRKATANLAGNYSIPQIWINKQHIGGCDDLKTLDVTGDLALRLVGVPRKTRVADAEKGLEGPTGASVDSAVAIYPGPEAAFFSAFHFPVTVDHRVVRLNCVITFIIALLSAAFADRSGTTWVVFGLFIDFALKIGGFPSPLDLLAALPFAGTKPHYSPGAPQQFANMGGVFFAFISWAFLVGDMTAGAYMMLVVLGGVSFLQGFLNFCSACLFFEYLVKWGVVSKSVYRMHINNRARLNHAWEKANAPTVEGVTPEAVTYPTLGLPSNPTDLKAKPRKQGGKAKNFHLIKYCHITYFLVPLSVLGLSLPWALLAHGIPMVKGVWQTLAWTGVVLDVILGSLFIAKCVVYPKKVKKEWCHPVNHNAFAIPFITLIFMSWLTTMWSADASTGNIARTLFWLGAAPLVSITIFTISSWIALPVDEEHMHPSWMIIPVGNLAGAVAARQVDPGYLEWGWFQFSLGTLLWLALWPITFRKAVLSHHSVSALRNLCGVWVAPPAMAMLAIWSLEDKIAMGPVQRLLFYSSLSIALVLVPLVWPLNFFLEGGFVMTNWAFAFPLNALSAAAVMMYSYHHDSTMKVIYMVVLSAACVVNAVNMLYTLGALKSKKLFIPAGKWSPLSFVMLTHQALRTAVQTVSKISKAVKPGVQEASSLRHLAAAWSDMSKAYRIHSMHEEEVVFPVLEGFFPGQTQVASEEHEAHAMLMDKIQTEIDNLLRCANRTNDNTVRSALILELKMHLEMFEKQLMDHLDHEELFYAAPVARKYLPLKTAKGLARDSWNATNSSDMSEFVGFVMANLGASVQRTRFLKTWVWAMPERAQLLGLMVYRVVDDITWVELARDMPELVPRGLPGHRRYF